MYLFVSEFQCEAYVDMEHNYRLLVTRQDFDQTEQYACWVKFYIPIWNHY